MNVKVAIVVLCLAVGAFATSSSEILAFVEKAQETPFGKTLWGTIELEVANGAPGDYLLNLLNKMRDTLNGDIVRANKTHETFQANCKRDIATVKNEISAKARQIIESKRIMSKSQQALSWDRTERDTQTRQREEAKTNLVKIKAIRHKEAEVFAQKVKELNDALVVLHQGKSMIENNLKKKGSFLQVSNSFNSYVQKMTLEITKPEYAGRGYVSVIAYIAELLQAPAVQANQGSVAKIIDMIQKIIDELENAKNIGYKAEKERIDNYHKVKETTNKYIADLSANIQKLSNNIINYERILAYNNQRITDNVRTIQLKKRLHIKLRRECQTENSGYKKENSKRQADFNLANSALELIKENLDEFRKIVLDNAKSHVGATFEKGSSDRVGGSEKNKHADAGAQALHAVHRIQNGKQEDEESFERNVLKGLTGHE